MNKFLNRIVEYGSHMAGTNTRRIGRDVEALKRFEHLGKRGVPRSTIVHAEDLLGKARSSSLKARINTGVGLAAVGTGTYLGAKAYHRHLDNKILERIDSMSHMNYNQY